MKIAPILISMVVLASAMLGLVALSSSPAAAAGTTHYYVGNAPGCDTNEWANAGCWSLTSNGAGGAGQPTINDDAVFDTNSGGIQTGIYNAAVAHDLRVTNSASSGLTLNPGGSLTLSGSITVGLSPPGILNMVIIDSTLTFGGDMTALSGGGMTIQGNDQFNARVTATKPGAIASGIQVTTVNSQRGCTIDATDGSDQTASVLNWDETPPYHNTPGEKCALPAAPAVVSGTLYGCSAEFDDWFSMLYTIDLGTAVAHPVGFLHDSNGGHFTKCSSLIVKDGLMYTWARQFCAFPDICSLSTDLFYYRIDPSNAQVTQIMDGGPGTNAVTGMALRASDQQGFMIRKGNAGSTLCANGAGTLLCSLNADTGASTRIGAGAVTPSGDGNAIAFNSQGVLDYAVVDSGTTKLFSLSTTTAATTFIANIPNQMICASGSDSPVNDLALARNGQMFASLNCDYGSESHLTILDPSTGVLTDLGRVRMDYGNYVDASLPTDSMAGLVFYAALAPPTTQLPPPPPPAYVPPTTADIVAGVELALAAIIVIGLAGIFVFRPQGRVRKWAWIIVALAALTLMLIYFAPAFFNF